jgi:hypothetical protein
LKIWTIKEKLKTKKHPNFQLRKRCRYTPKKHIEVRAEYGKCLLSTITLKKIADALEVTTDYLLGGDNDNVIKDTQLLAYFKAIDAMPDDIKDYKTLLAYK